MLHRFRIFAVLLLCFTISTAYAIIRPEVLLQQITQEMLDALKTNDKLIKKEPSKLIDIIEDILVPHIDIYDMSRWVVGRNAWLKASKDQRIRFSKEFKVLIITQSGVMSLTRKEFKLTAKF